jgi:hypothetical protein
MTVAVNQSAVSPIPNAAAAPLPVDYDNPLHAKYTPTFRRLPLPIETESRSTRLVTWTIAFLIAGLYLFALLQFWAPAHPGVDQNGYFVGGRQFAETLSTGIKLQSDYEFIGRMYIRAPSGENFPKYPLGLPILFAFCIWLQPLWNLVNWDGHDVAHLISPVSAALATLGMFAFVRRLAGSYLALLSMLVLGLSNVMLILAINPNSHALGTCLTVWSFYLMVRWLETGSLWRGVLCAFLLGYAFLVRYTEGLQALPLAVAMLYAAVWWRPRFKRVAITFGSTMLFVLIAFGLGKWLGDDAAAGKSWIKPLTENGGMPFKFVVGFVALAAIVSPFVHPRSLWRLLVIGFAWLVPVLYQTIFNMVEMGAFTSYAGTNESTGFDRDYFVVNWEKMIRVLNDQGLFFIAPIGFVGLIVMFRRLPLVATILTLWFVPSVLLYTAYYWAPDQWGVAYSRFILTELPALIIPAAWLLARVIDDAQLPSLSYVRFGWLRPASGVLLVTLGVAAAIWFSKDASAARDAVWWTTVAPAILLSVLGLALVAHVVAPLRPLMMRQVSHPIPRLAIGAAVVVASGVATFRAVNGTEWGQRLIPRANLEAQSLENKNLAQLGKVARDIIPPRAVVFADGDRLHHLQWISTWQMFPADGFNPETVRRLLWRSNPDESEPDPIDPGRLNFLRDVYADKNQADLIAAQSKITEDALRSGRGVFLVLTEAMSKSFIDKFVKIKRKPDESGIAFEAKERAVVVDTALPVLPEDLLEPSERPKMPIGRAGKPMMPPQLKGRGLTKWCIVEIVEKKPAATQPTTQPATVVEAN